MKTIYFTEYTYVLNTYRGEVEISEEDYKKLQNDEIKFEDIMGNYNLDYDGDSEADYDNSKFDSIEWEDSE